MVDENGTRSRAEKKEKKGRATDRYKKTFWNAMRRKNFYDVENALQVGMMTTEEKSRLARDELALGGLLPGKTPEEISDLLNAKIEEGMVNIGIAAEPIFEENGKKGRIGIENIEANRYSFQVDIILDETGEKLYQSGLIDPGYYIEFIELERQLQAGDYEATAIFSTYSLDESEDRIAETRVKLTLHVMDGIFYR